MKNYLLLLVCFTLAGCSQEEQHHREVMNKLDALGNNLSTVAAASTNIAKASVRWAYANRNDISMAVFQWTQAKLDEAKKAENLPPDQQAKVADYDNLQAQLTQKRIQMYRSINPVRYPGSPPVESTQEEKDYDALARQVADARAPIADIINRRDKLAAQYREQYSVEHLIAEYVNGRYDIVVESNQKPLYRSAAEVPDITDAVIAFFKSQEHPL